MTHPPDQHTIETPWAILGDPPNVDPSPGGPNKASVDTYAARVDETAGSIKAGVAALLADAFKVKVPGLNATQEDKDLVLSLVGQADEIVQAFVGTESRCVGRADQSGAHTNIA